MGFRFRQLFARKPIHNIAEETVHLRRVLGPVGLTALGVGAIIGAGIFVMTGKVAAQSAGPAILLSFVVAGTACTLAALCYAEFASLAPVAGSAYTYAYATVGELIAWVIGWCLVLEYALSGAVVSVGWSKYFDEWLRTLFNVSVPAAIAGDPFTHAGAWFNLPAFVIMALVTTVLVVGIRESATTNVIMVIIKVSVVLFVIAVGSWYVNSANWTDIPPSARHLPANPAEPWGMLGELGAHEKLASVDDQTRSNFAPYGLSGIFLGASLVFFAYLGFDAVSTQAEEARRPARDVPIGILVSLAVCTILYMAVAAVITGMEPYPDLNPDAAVASAFRKRAEQQNSPVLRASAGLIATGALAGMTSVLLVNFLSQARIFLAMARDGLLPRGIFGAIHPRFRTPHRSTLLTGGVIAVVAAFTPIGTLEEMVNIGTLLAFTIVCVAVMVLRVEHPELHRPFRTPLLWVVAPLGILINIVLMLFLKPFTWWAFVVWLAVGLVVYFSYGHGASLRGKAIREGAVAEPKAG